MAFLPDKTKREPLVEVWKEFLRYCDFQDSELGICHHVTATVVHSQLDIPKLNPIFYETYLKIKHALDPDNILNPGYFSLRGDDTGLPDTLQNILLQREDRI